MACLMVRRAVSSTSPYPRGSPPPEAARPLPRRMAMIELVMALTIGILPHPPDPYYLCLMVTRPLGMAVLCAPAGDVLPEEKRVWTGACHADECP